MLQHEYQPNPRVIKPHDDCLICGLGKNSMYHKVGIELPTAFRETTTACRKLGDAVRAGYDMRKALRETLVNPTLIIYTLSTIYKYLIINAVSTAQLNYALWLEGWEKIIPNPVSDEIKQGIKNAQIALNTLANKSKGEYNE